MRFLLVSIFVISLMGILLIPNAFGVQYPVLIHGGVADDRGMNFLPSVIEIEKGDTITWKNLERGVYHTVTSASGLFDERLINCTYFEGGVGICGSQQSRPWKPTFSYTFEEFGTYDYNCKLHSWMKGVVKVIEIGGDAEIQSANFIKQGGVSKPVVAFISGQSAPKGTTMGHAGAIIECDKSDAKTKMQALSDAGVYIAHKASLIGETLAKALKEKVR